MDNKALSVNRLYLTAIVSIAIWSLLAWDYNHRGVPSHHLLAREDLPSVSNWWGGVLLPLLTWFLLYRIQKRIGSNNEKNPLQLTISTHVGYGFIGALLFGIVLSFFFTLGNENVPFYMMLALLLTSLFLPTFRAEYFLGFVIGMTYTFGGVLPIGIGTILLLLCSLLYLIVRPAISFTYTNLKSILITKK